MGLKQALATAEDSAGALVLGAMALLPVIEIVARTGVISGVPGSGEIVPHLTLWVAFLGAALAAREGKLLSIATGALLPEGKVKNVSAVFTAFVTAAIAVMLARASYDLVLVDKEYETEFASGLPVWVAQLALPISFTAIALRVAWRAAEAWPGRLIAAAGMGLGYWLALHPEWFVDLPAWPLLSVLLLATLLGGPLFAAIGGAAVLLFMVDDVPISAVPTAAYGMAVSPHLPAIPLFTLAGFLLAEGDVAQRLLRLFRAWFGWMPGGTAIVCATLCAFLTVFTGGSGVTILVVGGLLLTALQSDGYNERFSIGLLTASGSLGLLLPPALPLILYGIVAEVPIENLFLGGIIPGLFMVALIAAWGVREGIRGKTKRAEFSRSELWHATWQAKFELGLPVFVLVALFGGFATIVEAASLTALYALVLQLVVHRKLALRELPRVARECLVLVGGVLLILAVAMGLTSWLVDAEIPAQLVEWAGTNIESKLVFLIALNLFLLAVGCVMDIFSATVVIVPLIVPLGLAFGIDPVHLGILFVANLELGYLTPPVGLNLFLASYRFNKPLIEIYRATFPMLLILAIGVLVITYVPWLTTALVDAFGDSY
jgi:C4-dicarboxylate transporter, DctM subunit